MDRKALKQIRTIVTSATRITGSTALTDSVRARAQAELSAVSDTYQTAALAGDMVRAQLAACTDPRQLALLTKALRDIMAIQTEARQEARDTVAALGQDTQSTESTEPKP